MPTIFDTTQPSQTIGLNGYTIDPIFTVGDKIGNYVPPGILDGIGAFSLNDTTVRLYVNHEIVSNVGYKYSLANGTQLSGARVSYFDVDKRTFQIVDSGLAYNKIINRAGNEVTSATAYSATNVNGLDNGTGLSRFCSASLFEANQFGAGRGLADRIFFTGEESGSTNVEYALDTKTGNLYALPWFGRAGFENVAEVDTGTTNKVAFLIGDDRGVANPLLLYVGDKNPSGSFLERNGLSGGKLYAWVADDPNDATDPIEADPRQFNGNNKSLKGQFVEIKLKDAADQTANPSSYDSLGFATQAKQDALAFTGAKAFGFARVEDVATNPKDGTQVAFNATGRSSLFAGQDSWGTTYRIKLDFTGIAAGKINGNVDILNDGNVTKDAGLRSPDNLDWADDGKLYLQEDPAFSGFGQSTKIANSIFSLDPSNADPSSTLTRIAVSDRSAAGLPATQTDSQPNDIGFWETSGILDVSTLFGAKGGQVLIFDTQAHSLIDGTIITATNSVVTDVNGDGKITGDDNLVEGGQLAFLIAPNANLIQSSTVVSGGTSGNDSLEAKVTAGFDGINDIVFSGSGNDKVDTTLAGALASGNRVDTGSGDDEIFVSNNDRVFGGEGNDKIVAQGISGFRVSGGAGNDTFELGASTDGRALGGDGDDTFFASSGGGNLLSGGAGADTFNIFSGDKLSAANIILDFQIGTDKIGIGGGITSIAGLTLTGSDIIIKSTGATIATLTGITTSTLTASDFKF